MPYLSSLGSVILLLGCLQRFVILRPTPYRLINCRLNLISVIRTLYNVNIILTVTLISLATFKSEGIALLETSWEQILAPLYFYMTELLLVSIISFVVLVNSVI